MLAVGLELPVWILVALVGMILLLKVLGRG